MTRVGYAEDYESPYTRRHEDAGGYSVSKRGFPIFSVGVHKSQTHTKQEAEKGKCAQKKHGRADLGASSTSQKSKQYAHQGARIFLAYATSLRH